jgi:lysozyme-like protein
MSSTATSYTNAQLQQLWIKAGGSKAAAPIAAAIAMAESRGDPDATDDDADGSEDRGLWQINSVHGALSTYEPLANAQAAVQISDNGTDWSAWTTYVSGAFKQFLTGHQTASLAGVTGTADAAGTTPSSASSSSGSSGAYDGLGGWLLQALLTVALAAAGLVLAGVGARNMLANQ